MSWLQQIYTYGRQIFSLTQKVERHDTDIEKIRRELADLTKTVERVIYELHHDRALIAKDQEAAAKDRELLLVRLENQLLRFERRLPPPPDNSLTDDC